MTPEVQEQFGRAWAEMAASEGHVRRMPQTNHDEQVAGARAFLAKRHAKCRKCGVRIAAQNKARTCQKCRHTSACECTACRNKRQLSARIGMVVQSVLADGREHTTGELLDALRSEGVSMTHQSLGQAMRKLSGITKRRRGPNAVDRQIMWMLDR